MSIVWTNPELRFLYHERIIEYDIRSANTSLMNYYGLASEDKISKLIEMKKEDREIAVGKMMRKSKEFALNLEKAFTDIVEAFLEENHLDRSEDIVSIKKDAVFVRNRSVRKTKFGEAVLFRPKGEYDGFLQLSKGKLEFYHQKDGHLDVKGISDELLPLHNEGVLDFISNVFAETKDWTGLQRYLKEYAKAYKERELVFDAYRQFDANSKFLVRMFEQDVLMDNIDDVTIQYTDISYNYLNIFLEVLKIVIGR